MNHTRHGETVLALYPTTRGLGFVVMRSPLSPIDWGTRDVRGSRKNAQCLEKIAALIDAHQPDAIVLEDPTTPGGSRSTRIKRLARAIAALADSQAVDVHAFARRRVQGCFEALGAKSRQEIAVLIAKRVPAFERFLPPKRRLWTTESARMSIFCAAALAITFFGLIEE